MFAELDVVGFAEAAAARRVEADRKTYLPFFRAAEELAIARGMVFGGGTADLLLLGEPMGIGDYRFVLYSANPFQDAKALADAVYEVEPEGKGKLTTLFTTIAHEEYSVSVDERRLFEVKALVRGAQKRRVTSSRQVVEPSTRPGLVTKKPVLCMGAELRLLDVYAQLSDPAHAGDWASLLERERALREVFAREHPAKTKASLAAPVWGGRRKKEAASPVLKIVRDLATQPGRAALNVAGGKLQIVTETPLRSEAKRIEAAARKAGARVQTAIHDPGVPSQVRLRRLTVYHEIGGGRRRPVADLFNLGEHEAVPLRPGMDRTTPPPALRIRLVDMWTTQLLRRQGKLAPGPAREHIARIARAYLEEAAEFERACAEAREPEEFTAIFPLDADRYLGHRVDPVLAQKRERFRAFARGGSRRGTFPYYPAKAASKARHR